MPDITLNEQKSSATQKNYGISRREQHIHEQPRVEPLQKQKHLSADIQQKKPWISPRLLWEQRESNPRPSACKADALNQLSYAPETGLQIYGLFSYLQILFNKNAEKMYISYKKHYLCRLIRFLICNIEHLSDEIQDRMNRQITIMGMFWF